MKKQKSKKTTTHMKPYEKLLESNKNWAIAKVKEDPEFFFQTSQCTNS